MMKRTLKIHVFIACAITFGIGTLLNCVASSNSFSVTHLLGIFFLSIAWALNLWCGSDEDYGTDTKKADTKE